MQNEGTVKWFNTDKGYGFIVDDNSKRDVFVHFKNINGGKSLLENSRVSYDMVDGKKGKEAANVKRL